jgi:hypothetical protein
LLRLLVLIFVGKKLTEMSADIPQRNTVCDFFNGEFSSILDYCLVHNEIEMCRYGSSHSVICVRGNIKQKIGKEEGGICLCETRRDYTAIRLYGYTAVRLYRTIRLFGYTVTRCEPIPYELYEHTCSLRRCEKR